jgi:phosphoribosylaminoimidazole-succinocarboxamide synthase
MTGDSRPLFNSDLRGAELVHRGKVRDMYARGDVLWMVTTDRLSAFDCVFPTPIPGKGAVLAALSVFWFDVLRAIVPNHFLRLVPSGDFAGMTESPNDYAGRVLEVRRCKPLPVECIVRGSLEGSGWKDYLRTGRIMEHLLPAGLKLHDRLPEPIFTPSTKAAVGHDENITFAQCEEILGAGQAAEVRRLSIALFVAARDRLAPHGIILADTKFEFGHDADGVLTLVDEALTPDSSRFLVVSSDGRPVSFDKQFVRDWAESSGWDKQPHAPPLPPGVVAQTAERYRTIADKITAGASRT